MEPGVVTVTVADAVEPAKVLLPAYVAVMVLAPAARLDALTVSEALAVAPAAARVAVPRAVVPREKVTVPVGAVVPAAGLTEAVNCVVAV